jgi:membrane-associated phospholipid phosphatase
MIKILIEVKEHIIMYLFFPLFIYFLKGKLKIQQNFSLIDYYVLLGLIMFLSISQFTIYTYAETHHINNAHVKTIHETKLDKLIPKISDTVYIYHTLYILGAFLGMLSIKNFKQASYILFFIMVLNIILFFIYIIYPTKLDEKSRDKNEKNRILKEIDSLDTTGNAWPSTHVTLSVFISYLLYPVFKNWSFLFLVLNCISALTTKQHYIPDVISGLALGSIYTYLVRGIFNPNNF